MNAQHTTLCKRKSLCERDACMGDVVLYPEEEVGGDEGTARVERSSPTGVKMCLVIQL